MDRIRNIIKNNQLESGFLLRVLIYFLPVTLLVAVAVSWFYQAGYERTVADIKLTERHGVDAGKDTIQNTLEGIDSDIYYLANSYAFKQAINTTTPEKMEQLAEELRIFSDATELYDQIRWIDNEGNEKVRINFVQDHAQIAPRQRLQNKQQRYFFKETMKLAEGELFVSPFDLNLERGELELPFKPTIRFALPLFDEMQQRQGVIVLNYLGSDLLQKFSTVVADKRIELLNNQGYWLKNQTVENEWGFMLGRDSSLAARRPNVWKKISSTEQGQFETEMGIWTYNTIYPLDKINRPDYYWKVAMLAEKSVYIFSLNQRMKIRILIIVIVILFWLMACMVIARHQITNKQNERQMRESEERLRTLADNTAAMVWQTDLIGRPTFVNQTWVNLTGLPVEIATSRKGWLRTVHPDDIHRAMKPFYKDSEHKKHTAEYRVKNAQGTWTWLVQTAVPMFDENDRFYGYIGSAIDITKRKNSEEELSRSNRVLNEISQGENLQEVLASLCAVVHQQRPDVICSVLLMDRDGVHISVGAAPGLPSQYVNEIQGIDIRSDQAPCSIAAMSGKAQIVESISDSPPCDKCAKALIKEDIHSCWAEPILGPEGKLLGVVTAFHNKVIEPDDEEEQLIKDVASLSSVAIERHDYLHDLEIKTELLEAIRHAQMEFIEQSQSGNAFSGLLDVLLSLTESEYGFIGEVHTDDNKQPYLKMQALSDISWDVESKRQYDNSEKEGVEFRNLRNLFGAVLLSKESVISNEPKHDYRAGGLPSGHPDLNAFMGVPLFNGNEMVGMIGVANRQGGYDQSLITMLQPFLTTCANLIQSSAVQKSSEQYHSALEESEARWSFALEGSGDGVWDWDIEHEKVYYSPQWKAMLGYSVDDISDSFNEWKSRVHLDDIEAYHTTLERHFSGELPVFINEHRILDKSGNYHWMIARGKTIEWTDDKKPKRIIGTYSDISGRKQIEADLRIAATAFEVEEGIIITDDKQVIIRVNKAFTTLTGYSAQEAIGNTPAILSSGIHPPTFYHEMWETVERDHFWQGEVHNHRKDGTLFIEWLTITAVVDDLGEVTNYVGNFSDITVHREAEKEIKQLAFYDVLTGLPNRRMLNDRLTYSQLSSARNNQLCAVIFLDLDNFKSLNDFKGHATGDLILIELAQRIKKHVREVDTVSRQGGDEFVILLDQLGKDKEKAAEYAEGIAEKLLTVISQPFWIDDYEYQATASLGIYLFLGLDDDSNEIFKRADAAMYRAKKLGRNRVCFYDPEMQKVLEKRLAMESDLKRAIPDQLQLYFQPQITDDAILTGAEVLLRWSHPQQGFVSPAQFIELAEETSLIIPMGEWVLDAACRQIKKWEHNPETEHLVLAVNVSARQFRQADFVDVVISKLQTIDINPSRLKLELTESLAIEDVDATIATMGRIRETGVTFSLDDFGTGQSSLTYLKRLPFEQVKIDRSFVNEVLTDKNDAALVKTIIGMAENLNLSVIAEGVEIKEQVEFLKQHGCHNFQGYYFGKPVPLDEFEQQWIEKQ